MAGKRISPNVTLEWDEGEVAEFLRSPTGPLGRTLMHRLGQIVVAGAKRRAEVRSGRMRDLIRYYVAADEQGLYTDVISPATNPKDGFPYPIVHEGRKVRDRRPHRSLRPALRDIRNITYSGGGE